jgi:hypothetical protein
MKYNIPVTWEQIIGEYVCNLGINDFLCKKQKVVTYRNETEKFKYSKAEGFCLAKDIIKIQIQGTNYRRYYLP